MIRRSVLLAVVMLAVVAIAPARAAGPVIVSGPGSFATTYTQPIAAAQVGGELTYVNADLQRHDVVSVAYGPDTQTWCVGRPAGRCPLFWSKPIATGGTTPVRGLENIQAGVAYEFYCSLHLNMTGFLVGLPPA